jgi:hypothetical protein
MTHAAIIRFVAFSTRITLRSGEVVRPVEDRFNVDGGDSTPEGTFVVLCATSMLYGPKGFDGQGSLAGHRIWRMVALDEIDRIDGATTADELLLAADSVIDVEADVRSELFGGKTL